MSVANEFEQACGMGTAESPRDDSQRLSEEEVSHIENLGESNEMARTARKSSIVYIMGDEYVVD